MIKLVSATPEGDLLIARLARVSNPTNQDNDATAPRLIRYLINHQHWSPFEMAHMVLEINTTRDIGRQILRHRSFSFQEFSQRYAEVTLADIDREARMKGTTNRQGSLEERHVTAEDLMKRHAINSFELYNRLLGFGVATECARAVLPEGLTPTRLYMSGTIRSWIHYCKERTAPVVQLEHRRIAEQCKEIFIQEFPTVGAAVWGEDNG